MEHRNEAHPPDGTKIAFTSDRDGDYEIYSMNADGTNQVNLTNNAGHDGDPSWQSLAPYRPDALIKLPSSSSFTGDGTYNATGAGQSASKKVRTGRTATFNLRVQDDGNLDDTATVKGCATASGLTPTYMDGATNVTTQVLAGAYPTGPLAPGATKDLVLKVKASTKAKHGASLACLITATSVGDGTKKDAVKATVTVK